MLALLLQTLIHEVEIHSFLTVTLSRNAGKILKAESIIHALGITDQKDLESLLSYFFDDADDAESDASDDEMSGRGKEESRAKLSIRVRPEQVVRVISKFIQDREDMRRLAGAAGGGASAASVKAEADEKAAERLESKNEEEQNYWNRMVQVVPDKQIRVWESLEKAMLDYNKVLKERETLINEVSGMQEQNVKLREILQQYLSRPINQEIEVPPTQTINM